MNDPLDTVEVIQSSSYLGQDREFGLQRGQGLPVGGVKGTVELVSKTLVHEFND